MKIEKLIKKRGGHLELFYLFRFYKPYELIKKFGYSQSTVYWYYEKFNKAKEKAVELLKSIQNLKI